MISNLLLWLDGSPLHYWLVAWAAFGCFVALAVAAFVWSREQAWWHNQWLVSAAMLVVLLAFRWPILLDNRQAPNADESQFIAGAMTLRHDPVYWRSVDGTTRGPLDDWPLTAASLLRASLDYTTARTVSVLLLWIELICGWLIFRHLFTARFASLLVLPLLAVHSFTQEWEFVAYCSEQVPDALVAIGCWLLLTAWHPEGSAPDLETAVCCGCRAGCNSVRKITSRADCDGRGRRGHGVGIYRKRPEREAAPARLVAAHWWKCASVVGYRWHGSGERSVVGFFFTCYILENLRYVSGTHFPPDRSFSLVEAPRKLVEIGAQAGNFNLFFFWVVGCSRRLCLRRWCADAVTSIICSF
jgi:hypothetical protein